MNEHTTSPIARTETTAEDRTPWEPPSTFARRC